MSKKLGDTNYFHKGEKYKAKDALGWFEKNGIEPKQSWYTGGGLSDWIKRLGIRPVETSPGGRNYYDSESMYFLCHFLEGYLKETKKAKSVGQQTSPAKKNVSAIRTNSQIVSQEENYGTFAEVLTVEEPKSRREPEQITIYDIIETTNVIGESVKALFKAISDCCNSLNEIKEKLGGYYNG